MNSLMKAMSGGYTLRYAPHNNRKRTKGRNYKYVKSSDGRIIKVWPDLNKQ